VFVSANGVRFFFEAFFASGGDLRSLASLRIAAIGPATAAALRGFGLTADFVPSRYDSQTLGTELAEILGAQEKLWIPRSTSGSAELGGIWTSRGISYRELPVYESVDLDIPAAVRRALLADAFDYIFFTAPSAVTRFAEAIPELDRKKVKAVCIGAPTADAAAAAGMTTLVAAKATPQGMIAVVLDYSDQEGKNG
jgi:uroporphyrinogen III methyltransferase/synthase